VILITGAGGKTGRALLRHLARQGRQTRVVVRNQEQTEALHSLGANETTLADLCDPESMRHAFDGVLAVYHIPPNVHPQEEEIGEAVIQLSQEAGAEHFVYHSVLRPYIRAMPHHLHKARVEEQLFTSGLDFTILQPAAYMQNTLVGVTQARETGLFKVPYPVDTRLGMVDLDEVAQAAASVLLKSDHFGATYELSGDEILTPKEIAETIGAFLERPVEAQEIDLDSWQRGAEATGMSSYQIETLLKMFRYYADYGFWGNANTLATLLGRPPITYREFLAGLELA
jgi:uncharacterized protein YbjT (DUF2867 family)